MSDTEKVGSMSGKIALITGGSRGIGRGVAEILIREGCTVYITGRNYENSRGFSNVFKTEEELNSINMGKCYAAPCDHLNDSEVSGVFETIKKNHGRLDILVNSAYSGTDDTTELFSKNLWEGDVPLKWTKVIDVGLRSTFISTCEALKIMVPQKSGMIFNISSLGGLMPLFNPLYGCGKEASDRFTVEMGSQVKKHNIFTVSLWPGLVRTEVILAERKKIIERHPFFEKSFALSEDPTLTGKAILHLALDPNYMNKTGRVHIVADLAHEYRFTDVDGQWPSSFRSLKFFTYYISPFLSKFVPHFMKLPGWVITAWYSKF